MAKRKGTTGRTTEIPLIPQKHGGALKAGGTPGNHGGRPREEWKRELEALLTSRATVEKIEEAINAGPDANHFWRAVEYISDRTMGKPSQAVDITSGGEKLTVEVTRK